MVIGDCVLMPCISVISAVGGIKHLSTVAILIVLFCIQRFGTDKVGFSFVPVVCLWLLFISRIGAYNLFKHDITMLRAFNPQYIVKYFQRNGTEAWISLQCGYMD